MDPPDPTTHPLQEISGLKVTHPAPLPTPMSQPYRGQPGTQRKSHAAPPHPWDCLSRCRGRHRRRQQDSETEPVTGRPTGREVRCKTDGAGDAERWGEGLGCKTGRMQPGRKGAEDRNWNPAGLEVGIGQPGGPMSIPEAAAAGPGHSPPAAPPVFVLR